jgi:transketolase
MQRAYISTLYEIMRRDRRVCSLLSDSGTDYDMMMFRDMPGQCFNFGIAEQLQIAAASGMAAMGKIPFVYTTGAFLAYRSYEFIRDDVCFQKRNVKMAGMGMGMGGWSTLGPSHHTTEDIAALRALPGLALLSASTPLCLARMVRAAYEWDGAVYIRMGMSAEEELYPLEYQFQLGKLSKLRGGGDIVIFTTGTIAAEAYHAAEQLGAAVYDIATIKPLDADGILAAVSGKRIICTVEEHQTAGGIGGAVAEVLAGAAAGHGAGAPLIRIGLDNRFARGYGTTAEVRKQNGLDRDSIIARINKHL